jgi:hypothetical protein
MERHLAYELLSPDTCALSLIDHQPQMFFGTHSHERTTILHNVQILAKLFKVPTVLMTSPPTLLAAICCRKRSRCF